MIKITPEMIIAQPVCIPYTADSIRSFFGEKTHASPMQVLKFTRIPPADRLWVVFRTKSLPAKLLKMFAYQLALNVCTIAEYAHLSGDKSSECLELTKRYFAADGVSQAELLASARAVAVMAESISPARPRGENIARALQVIAMAATHATKSSKLDAWTISWMAGEANGARTKSCVQWEHQIALLMDLMRASKQRNTGEQNG